MIGATNTNFLNTYNTLYSLGWRLHILQSFVSANGDVRYNAVWRRGDSYNGNGLVAGYVQEQPDFGVTVPQFVSDFNTIHDQGSSEKEPGWRPYILQTYVTLGGELLYNAVWRPGDATEADHQQATDAEFESDYSVLYPRGWRLYSFQSYTVPGGQVLHNAVWRLGTHDEKAVYGVTYADYRAKYDASYPNGWRLYILNTYVLPSGDLRYDAVWRLGTVDRPL